MRVGPIYRLGRAYDRYGPGRLPGADRRGIGGGYAFASAMVVFCLVYFLNPIVGVGWAGPEPVFFEAVVPAATAFALVVLFGFLAGSLTWGKLPEETPLFGAVAGFLASVVTHVLVVFTLGAVVVSQIGYYTVFERIAGILLFPVGGIVVVTRDLLDVAVVLYLVGIAGGHAYERLRAAHVPS